MLTVRLKIDGQLGDPVDTQEYGLVYLSADNKVGAETKGFESTSYPEQEGENIIPKTVDAPFDYKITFFVQASGSLGHANAVIDAFNQMLYTKDGDVKTFKQVTFYNDYKRVKIVGYPHPISEATQFWRDKNGQQLDVVVVEWTIRVTKPSLCEFTAPFSDDIEEEEENENNE